MEDQASKVSTALANLRHAYKNLMNGGVRDAWTAKVMADGLLAPAIAALEVSRPPASIEERDPQELKDYAEWASYHQATLGRPITVFDAWKDGQEARHVCSEAYQVVGSLLDDVGQFGSDQAEKVLDNLSSMRVVHDDVLPWPSFATGERGA